jgi:DNA-binding MarR family transcriptional regulator
VLLYDSPKEKHGSFDLLLHEPRQRRPWLIFDVRQRKCAAVNPPYTQKQGQYLAFIYYYTKLNRSSPSEADMQRYSSVSAPSVHQMVVTLEKHGFISRTPRQARSIALRLKRVELPELE